MGTIKKGILGGFSGKVGTVVGGSWKGIAYMRGQAQSIKNPRTERQVAQRNKLKFIVKALKPFENIINLGFKVGKGSPMNAAVSYNVKNAVTGTVPNLSLDYEEFMFSRGKLISALAANVSKSSGGILMDFEYIGGDGTDLAIAVGINKTTKEVVICEDPENVRDNASTFLTTPASWSGAQVACYIVMKSADGTGVSNSFYAGTATA